MLVNAEYGRKHNKDGCWSKILYPETDIFAKKILSQSFANSVFFFRGTCAAAFRSVDSANCRARCDQTGMSSTRMRSNWDVKHTAVIKLECQAQGCDQTRMSISMRSNWDVKHQDVAKQKGTRNWNPSCRRRYQNYILFHSDFIEQRLYHRCQQSNYLWTTGFPT